MAIELDISLTVLGFMLIRGNGGLVNGWLLEGINNYQKCHSSVMQGMSSCKRTATPDVTQASIWNRLGLARHLLG